MICIVSKYQPYSFLTDINYQAILTDILTKLYYLIKCIKVMFFQFHFLCFSKKNIVASESLKPFYFSNKSPSDIALKQWSD